MHAMAFLQVARTLRREGRGVVRCLSSASGWSPQAFTGGGRPTKAGLKRQCFFMEFNPEDLDQYLKDHEAVWPDMQEALVECGWHNYSLFYRPDGFAVGYFETDSNFDAAAKRMESREVNTRWQEAMSKYTAKGVRPDEAFGLMEQYFYLGTDVTDDAPITPPSSSWSPQAFTGGGRPTKAGLKRQCFFMEFNPEDLDQYLKDHEAVWPDMQEALVECGWHNYSLFYRPDGFAVGYFETDSNFDAAAKRMESREVNTRWQEAMSKYTAKGVRPDEAFGLMEQYFYLGTDVTEE